MPGETVARIAGGGYFLRLSLPERHASQIKEGDKVLVGGRTPAQNGSDTARRQGHIVKVYPEIEGGRVLADVEVDGLGDFFVGERTRVWIQVASRRVLAIPQSAVNTRYGIDYVHVLAGGGGIDVPVITGESFEVSGIASIEILTGLQEGDKVKTP
jgi:hypothetical protein